MFTSSKLFIFSDLIYLLCFTFWHKFPFTFLRYEELHNEVPFRKSIWKNISIHFQVKVNSRLICSQKCDLFWIKWDGPEKKSPEDKYGTKSEFDNWFEIEIFFPIFPSYTHIDRTGEAVDKNFTKIVEFLFGLSVIMYVIYGRKNNKQLLFWNFK